MALLDGWRATRELKASPTTNHIPVVARTAQAFDDAREDAKTAGCDGFFTTPSSPDDPDA